MTFLTNLLIYSYLLGSNKNGNYKKKKIFPPEAVTIFIYFTVMQNFTLIQENINWPHLLFTIGI